MALSCDEEPIVYISQNYADKIPHNSVRNDIRFKLKVGSSNYPSTKIEALIWK